MPAAVVLLAVQEGECCCLITSGVWVALEVELSDSGFKAGSLCLSPAWARHFTLSLAPLISLMVLAEYKLTAPVNSHSGS